MTVFPRTNLPPESVPWGRTIQETLVMARRDLGLQDQSLASGNRDSASNAGSIAFSLDRISEQFSELRNRRVEYLTHPGVFTTTSTTLNTLTTFSATETIPLPPTLDGNVRAVIVYGSMQGFSSNPAAGSANIGAVVSLLGAEAMTFGLFPTPSQSNQPPGWIDRHFRSTSTWISGGNLTVAMSGNIYGNGAFTLTVGVSDIEIALVYGEKQ